MGREKFRNAGWGKEESKCLREMAGCLTRGSLKLPCRPIERRDSQYCKLQNDNAGSPDQAVWHNNI
jgi:hypothetical protein